MQIKKTNDYSLFKLYYANREVFTKRIKAFAQAIKENDLTPYMPILVTAKNGSLEIVDGQNRFLACKELGYPIYYLEGKFKSKDNAIITLNQNQHQWKRIDYTKHFAKKGNANYQTILDIMREYGFNHSSAIMIVGIKQEGATFAKTFRSGKFEKRDGNPRIIAQYICDYKQITPLWNEVKFTRALATMIRHKLYEHKEFMRKFKLNKFGIEQCATVEQYLRMFETILNKNRRGGSDNKIRLV